MYRIFICVIFLSLFSVNEINSQTPCLLSGASVYLDYSSTPALMNASVNGMSLYDYAWNNGLSGVNQTIIYSGWCVTITDLITGCDTTICENCMPDSTAFCPCPMIYMPVCGCDGIMYSNSCLAICAGVGWSPAISNGLPGGWLPCTSNPTSCFVEISASGSTTFCEGDSIQLQPNIYDVNGTYTWSNGANYHEIWVFNSGDYILTYVNDTGCVAHDTMNIQVIPKPSLTANTIPNPANICLGDTLIIELTSGLVNYYWNTGNPLHQDQNVIELLPNNDFIYVCEVIDSNQCSNKIEVEVYVDTCVTSIQSSMISDINIFPNPTTNVLNLNLPGDLNDFKITLLTIDGKIIFINENVSNKFMINFLDFSKGSYILKIEHEKVNFFKKIIYQ